MNNTLEQFWKYYSVGVQQRTRWLADQNIDSYITDLNKATRESNFRTLLQKVNKLTEYSNYNISQVKYFTEKEFKDQHDLCEKKFSDFKLISVNSYLTEIKWNMRVILKHADPITNSYFDIDMGLFEIKFLTSSDYPIYHTPYKHNYFTTYKNCYATPIGENKPKAIGSQTCYHPHVSSDKKLCLGGYYNGKIIDIDLDSFNLWSIIYNVSSIINNYNPKSLNFSGADISNWVGKKCPICYQFCPDSDAVKCAKTNVYIHKDCGVEIDGNYYSPSEVSTCTACKKETAYFIPYSSDKIICKECDSLAIQPNQEISV